MAAADTLSRVELLRSVFGEESVRGGAEAVVQRGDSLIGAVDGAGLSIVERGAELSIVESGADGVVMLADTPLFYIVTMVTIFIYFIWMIRYISHRQRGDYSEERWIYGDDDDRRTAGFSVHLSDVVLSLAIMMGLITLVISGLSDWVLSGVSSGALGDFVAEDGALVRILTRVRIVGIEQLMIAVASYLLLSTVWFALIYILSRSSVERDRWGHQIVKLKSQFILPIMLFFVPFVALAALIEGCEPLRYIVVVELVILIPLYLLRSFLLFAAQKISILQWFLYLCTVELLPITVIWALFFRSVSIT
ncbi:MAG: hypothetical protein SNG14_03785 [Rikenellaceae bacterium]